MARTRAGVGAVICGGCGNPHAYRTFSGKDWECCNQCGAEGSVNVSDVFWDGKPEINLADDPRTGKPRVFASREEKARYLKERGMVQVDGRHHGGIGYGLKEPAKKDWKPEIRQNLEKVKQMGKAYRREQVWKMIKKSQAMQGR